MRLLLIDNYDSYTYNLYHLLVRACRAELTVMTNDDRRLRRLDPAAFDAVVISPGPGRPQHDGDLRWCRTVLDEYPDLPVLGVCLGYQALAYQAGARVVEGVARHGHLSRLRHNGAELFAGLPQDLTVTRYHSLHVPEPLPPSLQATAWAEDGIVMAVRHTGLPRWGVQFHPESVATEHGEGMVRNFVRLVAEHHGRVRAEHHGRVRAEHHGRVRAEHQGHTRDSAGMPAATVAGSGVPSGGGSLRLSVATIDRAVDPVRIFQDLYAASRYAFWLDSEPGRARFSFLGDASGPLAEVLSYRVGEGEVRVQQGSRVVREPGSIFDVLERRLADRTVAAVLPFDLTCGYVGYFGYETKADCGGSAVHAASTPDAVWMFADRLVGVDHHTGTTYLVATHPPDDAASRDARAWLDQTAARLRSLPPDSGPSHSLPQTPDNGSGIPGTGPYPMIPVDRLAAGLHLERDRDRYLADVKKCAEELRRGESYEICLTNRVHLPPVSDPLRYYLTLRQINPAPYAAYLRLGDITVMSSSPERFLRIERDGTVQSRPIKGTAPRDPDPDADERLRASLTASPKTRAENLMIVDLLRNDLGRVCEVGSIDVPEYLSVESYATVHQLVSTIRGRLLPTVGPVGCVRACFPGGSMTGAPKLRTMEIIDRLEDSARGVYSGALGYFGLGGGADLSVVIRTAVATPDGVTVGIGGAIVTDSDPDDEFAETIHKAHPLVTAYRLPHA